MNLGRLASEGGSPSGDDRHSPVGHGECSPGDCVVGTVQVGNLSGGYRSLVTGDEVHHSQPVVLY